MGNLCSSCCGNRDDDIFENSESDRTNLLGNPVGKDYRSTSISSKHADINGTNQQARLHQILEKTANSYIDVPALNAPLESTPVDRIKNYASEIEAALTKHHSSEKTSLLEDISHVERSLSDEPLSVEAREMMMVAEDPVVTNIFVPLLPWIAFHISASSSLWFGDVGQKPQAPRETVKEASSSILAALQSIQIENSENLVIPFDIPKDSK